MDHPLQSCRVKIDRAKFHFKKLEEEIGLFLNTDPYPLTRELDTDGSHYLFKITERQEVPRWIWGAILGDCVHNARSSLDHLVCGIEEWSTHKPAGRRSEFPICTDAALFRDARSKIRELPPDAQTCVERAQPYYRGTPAYLDALWPLQVLDNRDKHRLIPLATSAVVFQLVDASGKYLKVAPSSLQIFPGRFENGTIVAIVPVAKVPAEVDVHMFSKIEVIFEESPVSEDHRDVFVIETLRRIIHRVERIADEFDAYLQKHGLPSSKGEMPETGTT